MQCALKDSHVDFERMLDAAAEAGYEGDIGLEYLWIDWEHLNDCDTVSETILLRDRCGRSCRAGPGATRPRPSEALDGGLRGDPPDRGGMRESDDAPQAIR